MVKTEYAPIVIVTLNRYDHLERCIKSLLNNNHSSNTDVYVAVDYPPAEKYRDGHEKVCKLLKNIDCSNFNSFNVVYREKNYGSTINAIDMYLKLFDKYDRIITLEDDNELSPNFIDYCNEGLRIYENDESILAINASNYVWSESGMENKKPISTNNNVNKRQLIFHAYAIWKDKWQKVYNWCQSYDIVKESYSLKRMMKLKHGSRCFFYTYLNNVVCNKKQLPWIGNKIYPIDQVFDFYMLFNDMYVICPVTSLTKDWGCDGTGENFDKKFENYEDLISKKIDTQYTFNYCISEPLAIDTEEIRLHDKYSFNKSKDVLSLWLKYIKIRIKKNDLDEVF